MINCTMKIIRKVFIFLFFACIALPLIFLDRKTKISTLERRVLAPPPVFVPIGKINKKYFNALPGQVDAYISDRFAFRNRFISSMTWFNFFILHKSHDKKLLVGKDKWLFYIDKSLGDEFSNFKKTNLFNKEQMRKFLASITMVNDYCEQNNIKFIFLIVPTTSTVYPEQYPFPRPPGISLADQIIEALPENIRGKTIFPADYFIQKKGERTQALYYNNGLHWTKLGCYYAYELIYQKLKPYYPDFPEVKFNFMPYKDPGEDNYTILWWGIKQFSPFSELLNVEPQGGWNNYYRYVVCKNIEETEFNTVVGHASKKGKFGVITENKDQSLPTAVIIRDSYFVDLEPFTSLLFSKAEYIWTQPEKRNVQYIIDMPEKPDVLIWEFAERALEAIPLAQPGEFPWD